MALPISPGHVLDHVTQAVAQTPGVDDVPDLVWPELVVRRVTNHVRARVTGVDGNEVVYPRPQELATDVAEGIPAGGSVQPDLGMVRALVHLDFSLSHFSIRLTASRTAAMAPSGPVPWDRMSRDRSHPIQIPCDSEGNTRMAP